MTELFAYKLMQGGRDASRRCDRGFDVLGFAIILLIALVAVSLLYPVFAPAPVTDGHRPATLSNLKQLALAHQMYAYDHDEQMPPAEVWMDAIYPYTKNESILQDPEIEGRADQEYGFAFYKPLSLADTRAVADHAAEPLVFQSVLMLRNARSDLSSLPPVPRNPEGNAVAFLDGHAKRFPAGWQGHGR